MTGRNHLNLDLASSLAAGYDVDDFPAAQPDAHGEMAMFELHHPAGLMTMPGEQTADGVGHTMLYGYKGPDGFAWMLNDPRIQGKLPRLKPNETYLYGPLGQGVRCHVDGTISLFTTDQGPQQQSVYQQVKPTAFRQVAPWGSCRFDANGWHLKHVSQARIDLGAIGGLPAPLDALSSYVTLSAAIINLQGSAVALGAAAGLPDAVAKSTPILAVFAALGNLLTQLATPGAYVSPPSGGPCAPSPDVVVAVAATEAALAAAVALVPSGAVTVT